MKRTAQFLALAFVFILSACTNYNYEEPDLYDQELESLLTDLSDGLGLDFFILPESDDFGKIPQDPKNPLSPEKVNLGKFLYHETGLALTPKLDMSLNTYSCASCHNAAGGFQACKPQGISEGGMGFGLRGEARRRNPVFPVDSLDVQPIRTPSVLNCAYQKNLLWNGQFGATGLNTGTDYAWTAGSPKEANNLGFEGTETQAIAGLKVHRMDVTEDFVSQNAYKSLFDEAFPAIDESERYTRTTAGLAIGAYERTVLANEAPFQRWLKGDKKALSSFEKMGAILFFGKAQCASCHTGPSLNAMDFYAIGMKDLDGPGIHNVDPDDAAHKGRGGFTGKKKDMYKFKVPQLYNLKDSPFFGHGASYTSLVDLIWYKNEANPENPNVPVEQLAEEFVPLGLSNYEVEKIAAFIESGLYDPDLARYEPAALPSGNCFPNNDPVSRLDLGCD